MDHFPYFPYHGYVTVITGHLAALRVSSSALRSSFLGIFPWENEKPLADVMLMTWGYFCQ